METWTRGRFVPEAANAVHTGCLWSCRLVALACPHVPRWPGRRLLALGPPGCEDGRPHRGRPLPVHPAREVSGGQVRS